MKITKLGHCCLLIEVEGEGVKLLIDRQMSDLLHFTQVKSLNGR